MNLTSKRMLQFMTVCAGACALSATATTTWVSDSFEAAEGGTNGNPIAWYKMTVSGDQHSTNFLWTAAAGDASTIITSDAVNTGFADTTRPIPAANKLLVLNLSTEGQTLSRTVTNEYSTCSFDSASVYVDTLIKFTPSEDTPTIAPGTKVAVYVNVASNLVVYHQGFNGTLFITNSVTSLFINPTNWYRLTIEMRNTTELGNPACKIRLNGTLITHANAFMDDYMTPGGSWFITGTVGGTTLSAIAFQGTGAVDELVVTDIPADFGSSGIYLTLMFTAGQVEVTTNGVPVSTGAVVKDQTAVVITSMPWYEITSGGTLFIGNTTNTVTGTTMITNINGTVTGGNGTTNTITSQAYSQSGSIAAGLGASYSANKVAAWAINKAGSISPLTPSMLDEYLLNTVLDANPALKIDSIVYNAAIPQTTITVVATNGAGVVNFQAINGTMLVQMATNLVTGFGSATAYPITVTNTTGMTIIVPGAAGNFLKAVVQ